MSLNDEQYSRIREILYDDWGYAELDHLKMHFKSDINSKRRLEKIKTLPSLFRILEKRDVLGPEHTESLATIIKVIAPRNVEISNILSNRTGNNVNEHIGVFNLLGSGTSPRLDIEQVGTTLDFNRYPIGKISDLIKSRLGCYWQELARALRMPEGKIDKLDKYFLTHPSRVIQELLNYHQERCGSNWERWRTELQKGLVKVGRMDLSENIDEILVFNNV